MGKDRFDMGKTWKTKSEVAHVNDNAHHQIMLKQFDGMNFLFVPIEINIFYYVPNHICLNIVGFYRVYFVFLILIFNCYLPLCVQFRGKICIDILQYTQQNTKQETKTTNI